LEGLLKIYKDNFDGQRGTLIAAKAENEEIAKR
jgi:hypothetical protein